MKRTKRPRRQEDGRDSLRLRLTRTARAWFTFDRRRVVHQLNEMETAARRNTEELEMIAEEGIFKSSLCRRFVHVAKLYVGLIRELVRLRSAALRAKSYPAEGKTT